MPSFRVGHRSETLVPYQFSYELASVWNHSTRRGATRLMARRRGVSCQITRQNAFCEMLALQLQPASSTTHFHMNI